jgi:hypothetical protein
LDIRRAEQGEPPAKVTVIYDPAAPDLGYQSVAKARLFKGDIVGFYKGEWVKTSQVNEFYSDGSYAFRIPKSTKANSWWVDPKATSGSINSTDPLSCHGRYINCSLDPPRPPPPQKRSKRGKASQGKTSSGNGNVVQDKNNVTLVFSDDGLAQRYMMWDKSLLPNVLQIKATRTIEIGEPLLWYYGMEYWGTTMTMMSSNDPRRNAFEDVLDRLQHIESLGFEKGEDALIDVDQPSDDSDDDPTYVDGQS